MIKTLYINSFSEQGVRGNNEDSVSSVNDKFFIVCDGMGGHGHGEVASQTVAESLCAFFQALPMSTEKSNLQAALDYAVERLNEKDIYGDSEHKMGTTVVLAALTESSVLVGHVGDSRLYHIRPSEGVLFRTKDHSQVQEWVDAEIITEEEARTHPKKNLITRCVQPHPTKPIVMETNELTDLRTGDYLFLCTDGVTGAMSDEDIAFMISSDAVSDEEKVHYIKNACSERSDDNYSGFLLKLEKIEATTLPPLLPSEMNVSIDTPPLYETLMPGVDKLNNKEEDNPIASPAETSKNRKDSSRQLLFFQISTLVLAILLSVCILLLLTGNGKKSETVKPVQQETVCPDNKVEGSDSEQENKIVGRDKNQLQ